MASSDRDYPIGARIPGTVYEVLRRIGGGGMGTVYDVEDTTIGKRYVLKTLLPQLGAREDLARRMQTESRTLARLHHPNIVEVITAGVTADDLHLPYYVMERLDGQSLRVVLEKKGLLDLPHAYHIGIDLLDALDHAHDKGVIHRDVKPDNIFLHRTAANVTVTKLLDFGIVSMLDAGTRETAGRFVGTLRYASPEQLRGEKPTPQMDVYSAALVIFEMIAGRGPFADQPDDGAVAKCHLERTPPPLSRFVPVPRELDALLAAALAKRPEGRPRDAFSFAASLRNFKRALGAGGRGGSTESGQTGLAVLAPASAGAPVVAVEVRSPGGHYVVSPAPVPVVPTAAPASPASPEGGPSGTVRGMTPPTGAPAGTASADIPTDAAPAGVDRGAPTRTFAGPGAAVRTARLDAVHATQPAEPLPAEGVAPIHWPVERPPATSEEPHVRSMVAAPPPTRATRAAVVMAFAALAGLGTVTGALLVLRTWGPAVAPPSSAARPPAVVGLPPPPQAAPVVTMPAPTLAPPVFDEPGVPSVVPVPSAPSAARPVPPSRPRPAPSSAPPSPARPGPGF